MKEDDESREIAEAQQEREEQAQTDGAEELEDDEEDGRIETAEELAKKKTENKFKASGNLGNIQIFMQNADFRDGTGLKQILNLAYRDVGADPKYDLEKEDDCAAFFRNCKNKDYVTLAIVLSVFEMVSVGDLANLKDTLMECLPPVFRLDQEGKVISAPESNPYLSLNDVLPVIQGKIFVTEEGRQCIGFGREPSKVLKNMWIQFPALRKPIIIWLLKVNDTFEYRTTFEAYQIVTAFARVVSEDFPYAKKEVFERLYSNPKNLGLLARLAHELLKKGKNRNGSEEMVLKWAESDSEWLWKAALLVYLYADAPFPGEKLEKALALTVKKKFLRLHRGDLRFIAVYAGHFKNMRSFMTGVFRELGASQEKDYLPYLAVIYLYLTKYGYFMIDKKMTNLPFVVHDSQKQAVAMSPVLAYIMARYDLRRQLYSVLRAYLEEIADYDVPQSMIKHISAYFYILAQSDSGYRTDILMFLRESGGSVAKSVCHMLTEIYRNKGEMAHEQIL